MTDKLATEDYVALAEFCGKKITRVENGQVFYTDGSDPFIRWLPDEDAKQRDELVEALAVQELTTEVRRHPAGAYSCRVFDMAEGHVSTAYADTPGLAVCQATLKVIAEKP